MRWKRTVIAQATGFAETEDAEILQARQRYAQQLALHKEEIAQEAEKVREAERMVLLHMVDTYWMEHIDAMEELKKGIRFRAYGGTNPIDAYKQEGAELFQELVFTIQSETVRQLYSLQGRTVAIDGDM